MNNTARFTLSRTREDKIELLKAEARYTFIEYMKGRLTLNEVLITQYELTNFLTEEEKKVWGESGIVQCLKRETTEE